MKFGAPQRQMQGQNTQSVSLPAPTKGIYASGLYAATGDFGVDSAIWLYNMIPTEYGCRIRLGSREFATNIPGSASDQVRTVLYYNSTVAGGSLDKVFACTDAGIYDITAGGAGPWTADLVWPSPGGNAGWCAHINYTNVAGDHYLLVTDEANGYYIYDGTTWAAGTFTGSPVPLASDLVHIAIWNGRIWFVERNTARAWFLDPLALTGTITPFDVGSSFKAGGHLVQNSTWTLDDGAGMDDYFVQVSSGGDVLVWNGINPTVASDMTLIGRWQVGSVPEGRRVMSDFGGDVLVLSTSGIIRMSTLLGGQATIGEDTALTKNITRYIRRQMQDTLDDYGWGMLLAPTEGIMIVSTPTNPLVEEPIQFVMETTTKNWCMFRGLDVVSQTKRGPDTLFGDSAGRVMTYEGNADDADLAGASSKAVPYSMLSHYSDLGNAAAWKRPQFIRPYFIGESVPSYNIQMRYDFDIVEVVTAPPVLESGLSTWDSAIWDDAVWGGQAQSYLRTIGVNGMGRHIAVALRGESLADLSYIGADVMGDMGGQL